ncbi:MAG TPA: ABC transporter permease [Chryseosolibacter sp.]|nr:ABC transporter permease [Chryseosolibacter sp.]
MFLHYTKVIFRYLSRKMFFTALNVLGLSIGLASCIVIYLFTVNELSYDKFHRDGDQIYRVIRQSQINGMPYNIGVTAAKFAPALKQDFPQQIQSTNRAFSFNALITYQDKSFIEEKLLLADANFFDFFSFPLYRGQTTDVLKNGNSLVISKALAIKYFGNEDPIGRMIRVDDQYDMIVTGVMDELPGNSHLQFDAVGSMNIIEAEPWFDDWWSNSFNTYVKVGNDQDVNYLNETFPDFMDKYFGKDFQRVGNKIGLRLEPLRDIYFNYDTRYENNIVHGDRRYVYIFTSIGIFLLLLASINYINLATAQASSRAKEVGIRKTLGSSQRSVAMQFLSESFFLALLSLLVGIGVAQLSIPVFNVQFGLRLPGIFNEGSLWIFLFTLLMLMTIASGAYPAFLLSAFKPVNVFKGEVKGDLRYVFVRKALVIFQFGISGFMIISTLFIGQQLRYMRQKDLGFNSDQVIVVRLNNSEIIRQRGLLRESLLEHHSFSSASFSSGYPGGFYDATTVHVQGDEMNSRMRTLWTDPEFLKTMDLSMAAGRFFSRDYPADTTSAVVINETAVRQLGWSNEDALGKRIILSQFDSIYKEIIGVVKDYHFTSLKEKIEPLVISCTGRSRNLLLKVSGVNIPDAITTLERIWNSYETGFPLEFVFLDDLISRLYTSEGVQAKIFTVFSVISVVIACLGILGLTTFIASQRKKEIGVRKVLGATTGQVSALLMKDLLILVLIANLIAIPAGYWAMENWLEGFAYRIGLHPATFLIGSLVVFLIATVIVGLNASRVAMQNPANSLRTE